LKLFVRPLQSKTSTAVKKALEEIFLEFGGQVHVLQTDKGGEFIGCRRFFKEKKIVFRTKTGNNKASYAENFIFQIKKRLFMMLRGNLSQNWVEFLPTIVSQYNNSPNKKLGGLKPNNIHSEFDSVLVSERLREKNIQTYKEKSFHDQITAEEAYQKQKNNIQVNDFVYVSFKEDQFSKSYDTKVFY
jgi:hypothetical protein